VKIKTKFVVSINVYDDVDYLYTQLENIRDYLKLDYLVLLNCNNLMYDLLKSKNIPNVYVNPNPIDKKRFCGTLFKGIYENIIFSLKNFEFEYFLVMSSKTFFFKVLGSGNIDSSLKNNRSKFSYPTDYQPDSRKHTIWPRKQIWKPFSRSGFYKFIKTNNMKIQKCMHEGLVLRNTECEDLKNFFDKNQNLLDSIYKTKTAMEEIVIPTLCVNWYGFTHGFGMWPGYENSEFSKYKILHKVEK